MTRRSGYLWPCVVAAVIAVVVGPRGQSGEAAGQQPVFRAGTDLIELDVSVLGRDRRAVTGLTAADFTVIEDGSPQTVSAVSFVDITAQDPARSARMRFVPRDVAANDLADLLGSGRLLAVVFDDVNLPADDPEIVRAARETARYVIDQMGPSDMAAVVHARHSGRTEDFTSDRGRLLESIDAFVPETLGFVEPTPIGRGPAGGDMVQRWSPTLMRSSCLRSEPAVPALDAVTSRMATATGRRKALVLLSPGIPVTIGSGSVCGGQISDVMRDVFRKAQASNVNVYAIDPGGRNGYLEYLRRRPQIRQREAGVGQRSRSTNIRQMQDFMRMLADTTGGRAVINSDAIEPAVDQIFLEDRSYYLVGYASTNGAPDGKFRKVDVRINRPGVTVRTRSGYWAPKVNEGRSATPTGGANALAMVGLFGPAGLPLRASAVPVGIASEAAARQVDVSAMLTVRWPGRAIRAAATDTLTIVRHVYDATGSPGPPVRDVVPVALQPGRSDDVHHDVVQRLALAPGRYQVRFNVHSDLAGVDGTVYADLEVPDVWRSPLAIAGVVLGRPDGAGEAGRDQVVPLVPSSAREFGSGESVGAFARIYQGGSGALAPVTVVAEIVNAADVVQQTSTRVIEATGFDAMRGAPATVPLSLSGLRPGPYLFSLTARLPGGYTARKDVLIHVR